MALEKQYLCDGCNDVVHGFVRKTFYHKDYIHLKGSMSLQQWNKLNRKNIYSYLTKSHDDELTFCLKEGMPCVQRYIDRRRAEIAFMLKKQREEGLRKERMEELEAEEALRARFGH